MSSLLPKALMKRISLLLVQGGFEDLEARSFSGFAIFFAFSISLLVFFISPLFIDKIWQIPSAIAFFVGTLGLFYLALTMTADARARQTEEVLPVALQMISANIRAGMTLENAIWSSARPEFGPLKDEIKRMSADAFGGVPISQTLGEIPKRVNSQILERSVKLIIEGIMLGGEMAKLLDEVAADIRSTQLLQKEIAVSTTTYAIFIVFASIVAAPLLFSVSTYYSVLNEKLVAKQLSGGSGTGNLSKIAQAQGGGVLGGLGQIGVKRSSAIKSSDIKNFAIASITVTAFFASLLLGLILDGKPTRGLKYALFFILIGLGVYFGFSSILQGAFSTLVR